MARALGTTSPRSGVPVKALHVVFAIVCVGLIAVTAWLKNPISAYVWWAGSVVFFALITYGFVHASNFAYFRKTKDFNVFLNGVIPAVGIALAAYLIYESFFQSLWSQGWDAGRSCVVFGLAVCVLAAAYVGWLRTRRRDVITGDLVDADDPVGENPVQIPAGRD